MRNGFGCFYYGGNNYLAISYTQKIKIDEDKTYILIVLELNYSIN